MLYHLLLNLYLPLLLIINRGHGQPTNRQEHHEVAVRSPQTKTAIYWYTEVEVGTQKFNLTVDTGSSDLWLYAPELTYTDTDASTVMPHTTYTCDPATSASQCRHEGKVCVGYGGDTGGACSTQVSGYFVADRVSVAGKTVPTMSVGAATSVGWPAQFSQDGFLGLSWNTYNQDQPQQATFISCLMNDPTFAPVFAIDFPSIGKEGNRIDIEFGTVNSTKTAAGLITATVNKENPKWNAEKVSFAIGQSDVPVTDGTTVISQEMIFDTGAGPTMHVDPRVTMAYYSQVKGAVPTATDSKGNNVSYKFPCDASLPNLYLHFDDGAAAMAGRQMNFNIPDSENMCTGPLDSADVAEGEGGGVGTLFFQSHYVVFDMSPTQPRMQFAPWNATSDGLPHYS